MEPMEVTKRNSNKTYINKTHFNYTTTKESKSKIQNSGGGPSQNNDIKTSKNHIIEKIKDEYQINRLTKTYQRKIQKFINNFNSDIMEYAIEYAGEKSTRKSII